jgi:hypothetical protein
MYDIDRSHGQYTVVVLTGIMKTELGDPVRAVQACLALFLTCRQISQEAVSVFYQCKTFLVIQMEQVYEHGKHYSISSRIFGLWPDRLGSQRSIVKTIWVARGSMSRVQSPDYDNAVAFLPFLRIVWKHSLRARISIAHTLRPKSLPYDDQYQPFLPGTKMSLTVQGLCNDDINVAKFHRTLAYIAI